MIQDDDQHHGENNCFDFNLVGYRGSGADRTAEQDRDDEAGCGERTTDRPQAQPQRARLRRRLPGNTIRWTSYRPTQGSILKTIFATSDVTVKYGKIWRHDFRC